MPQRHQVVSNEKWLEARRQFLRKKSVLDQPGVSLFYEGPRGAVFHTYSTYARGLDILNTAYNYLDLVPKGRDEAGHDFPMFWVRRRNEYGR